MLKNALIGISLISGLLATQSASAAPLKLITDLEIQNGEICSNSICEDGKSLEATVGLKNRILPWMEISGGYRYYEEHNDLSGYEIESKGLFIKVQTVTEL